MIYTQSDIFISQFQIQPRALCISMIENMMIKASEPLTAWLNKPPLRYQNAVTMVTQATEQNNQNH